MLNGTVTLPDGREYTLFVAPTSCKPKSMLEQLSPEELASWIAWMKETGAHNGMDWPGWTEVRARS